MRRSMSTSRPAPAEPCLECLEPRLVLAAVSWDGGAGTLLWHDAANWSTDAVPGIADDVTIDVPGSPTIEFGEVTGSRAVRSLLTRDHINMWGGTLTVETTAVVQNNANVRLGGVTLNGGAWSAIPGAGTLEVASSSSVLLGVSVTGGLRFIAGGSSATMGNGTTFDVARLIGAGATIRFAPGQTVTGEILFEGAALSDQFLKMAGSGTLTIGPTGRIATAQGFAGTGRIGVPGDSGGVMTLINHGTIAFERGRAIIQPEQFTSTGTLRAASPGSLTIEPTGSWTNSGAIIVAGGVTLLGAWSNTGSISVSSGSVTFGGTFTTGGMNLAQFSRVGGNVTLSGTLDNSGSTLTLDAATGSWNMIRGTINGGSVSITGSATLTVTGFGQSFLNGTSISGDLVVAAGGQVAVDEGAAFVTARLTGNNSSILLTPGYVLTGTVLFDGAGGSRSVSLAGTGGTLTIGPTGQILTTPGFSGTGFLSGTDISLVNEGVIAAAATDGTVLISQSFTTSGTLRVSAGTLRIAPTAPWSNDGTITVEGGTLDLGGTFRTAGGIGAWSRSGGTVDVTGTLDNTGATTTLDNSTGSWRIIGAITGGTMNLLGGQVLTTSGQLATLTGVTVNGEIVLTSSYVTIAGGTTFTTLRLVGSFVHVRFAPGQTLSGTIVFEGPGTGNREVEIAGSAPGTLTIGPTGRIVTAPGFAGTGRIGDSGPAMTLVNEGFIGCDVSGRTVRIEAAAFTNTPGGSVAASGGGAVEVGGAITDAGLLSGVTGVLAITGTLNNQGSTVTLSAATGSWHLKGGTVTGGVIDCTDGQVLVMTSAGGTLSGVAVNGELSLLGGSAGVTIAGGSSFTIARLGGSSSTMYFAPGQTVTGTILFVGAATGTRSLVMSGFEGTLTIGPTGQIRTAANFAGIASIGSFGGEMTLLNEGLIGSEVIGRTLSVQPRSLTNTGTMRAVGGGVLSISPDTATNFAAGVLNGGEWVVGAGSTMTTFFGSILTNSAAITLQGAAVWAAASTITTNTGALRLLGGRDHGVAGPFTNSGALTLSPGSLLTAGGFTQTASGRLEVQISGPDPVTQTGRIVASGAASLDGRLDVVEVDAYVPAHPVTIQFIAAASVTGTFAQSTVPDLPPTLRAVVLYDSTGVRFRVTSIADIDGDGTVNSADISTFLTMWLESLSGGPPTADFNGDGIVNSSDINAFLTAWLEAL